jgi:hypothetical protein
MLHSLQPAQYVVAEHLRTPWSCPQCNSHFLYGDGVMSLTSFREVETGEVKHGLICLCSTTCLLLWEPPPTLDRMH